MALNVTYTNRIGRFTLTQHGKKYTIHLCHANALCAMMYFYTEEREDGKHKMVQLWSWFNDLKHAENCLKDERFFEGCDNFRFNTSEMDKNLWKLVQLLVKAGKRVTIA